MPTSWMHAFVDVPAEDVATAQVFWSSVVGWSVGDPWPGHPEFTSFVPDGGAPYARPHLDLGTDDLHAEVARVRSLGAHVLWANDGFTALRDPLGLPFCVTANDPAR